MRYKVAIKKYPEPEERSDYKTYSLMDAYRHIGEALDNPLGSNHQAKATNILSLTNGFYAVLYEYDYKENVYVSFQMFQ